MRSAIGMLAVFPMGNRALRKAGSRPGPPARAQPDCRSPRS